MKLQNNFGTNFGYDSVRREVYGRQTDGQEHPISFHPQIDQQQVNQKIIFMSKIYTLKI